MSQARLTLFLLQPSLSSFVACFTLSVGVLGVADWAFVTHNALFYGYLFGPYGLVTAMQNSPHTLTGIIHVIFKHSVLREALSFLFIFTIGAVVYTVLQGTNKVFNGVRTSWTDAGDARKGKKN